MSFKQVIKNYLISSLLLLKISRKNKSSFAQNTNKFTNVQLFVSRAYRIYYYYYYWSPNMSTCFQCSLSVTQNHSRKFTRRRVLNINNNYSAKQHYTTMQHTTSRFTIARSLLHKELPVNDAAQDDNFHDDNQDQNEFVGDHASVHGAQYLATRRQVLISLFEPLFGPD